MTWQVDESNQYILLDVRGRYFIRAKNAGDTYLCQVGYITESIGWLIDWTIYWTPRLNSEKKREEEDEHVPTEVFKTISPTSSYASTDLGI